MNQESVKLLGEIMLLFFVYYILNIPGVKHSVSLYSSLNEE